MRPKVEIYTDGGCHPNPGRGGFGAVLVHPKKRAEFSGGFRLTTNNRMEIYAAIHALENLKVPCEVTLYSDSQYVVNAISLGWAAKWKRKGWWRTNKEKAENADLWDRLLQVCEMHKVHFQWIKGHAGLKENERCDQLSRAARGQPDLPRDEGYETKPESPERRAPLTDPGEPCWKCSTPVVRQQSQKKRDRDYYFEYYLYCPRCGATYELEAAKRFIENSLTLGL